jgi:2-polyprenyl-3-methyl-5-hydroxy-6-metoxy-1,4-benzoquinol methylase
MREAYPVTISETLLHGGCPVCQADGNAWSCMKRYRHARLHRCRRCGHVFADGIPTGTELDRHYGGYPRAPCSSEITLRRYEELLDAFEPYRQRNRLLDVGCGVGDFLVAARARGWEVQGVELEQRARAICADRGLTVIEAPLDPARFPSAGFDVVSALEVLEHMIDPRAEMHSVASVLRPGGLLYVTTPNFASLTRRLLGPRSSVIAYPEHLGYFRPATLERLLSDAGLVRIELRATGFSVGQVRDAIRSGAPSERKSVDESLRSALEHRRSLKLAKRAVNFGLSRLSLGDTLKASYQRI